MSDDTKDRDDPAHQTMPPELRPFAKPVPPQRLVAPENEARFKATIGVLSLLNGGPKADPFYVDPKNDPALAEREAPESVKAYAPPTELPAAEAAVRQAAPAKVVIADTGAPAAGAVWALRGDRHSPVPRCRRTRRAARRRRPRRTPGARPPFRAPRAKGPPAATASPWAKEAAPEPAQEARCRPRSGPPRCARRPARQS